MPVNLHFPLPVYTLPSFPLPCPRKLALRSAPPRLLCFLPSGWFQPVGNTERIQERGKRWRMMHLFLSLPSWFRMLLAVSDDPFSRAPVLAGIPLVSLFPFLPLQAYVWLHFPALLVSGWFNIPGGFFRPDHISVNSLFYKVYSQIILGTLSAFCSWSLLILYPSGLWTTWGWRAATHFSL